MNNEVPTFEEHVNESAKSYDDIATKNFKRWNDLLQTKDPNKLASLYTENSTFLPTMLNKFERGKDGAKEYFEHFMKKDPIGKIIKVVIQTINDQKYLESGMYDFEVGPTNKRTTVHARFTFLWEKIGNEWMIAHHHSSLVPE